MVDGGDGGGPESGPGSKPMSTCESHGGRIRFTVELRPGETTIVSWKKLLKESNSSKRNGPDASVSGPSSVAEEQQPASQAPPPPPPALAAPKQPAENEARDSQAQAGTNGLSTVIEKIERMYAGDGSSEDEDNFLDDVPDDDEYDTEDSFIDDAELDDYFKVDNSSIKHDGFFINRGKLEQSEPAASTKQPPKKRRRKGVTNSQDGNGGGQNPNKHVKLGNKGRKASSSIEKNSTNQATKVAPSDIHGTHVVEASQADAADVSLKKKTADTQTTDPPRPSQDMDADQQKTGNPSSHYHDNKLKDSDEVQGTSAQRSNSSLVSKSHSGKQLNKKKTADTQMTTDPSRLSREMDADQQRTGVSSPKNHSNKLKDSSELQGSSAQRPNSSLVSKSHSGKQLNNADDLDHSVQQKEKSGLVERFDLNIPASRDSLQISKVLLNARKDGSSVRPKITMLDKAIRELEKMVAESRPPSMEVQDPDNSSQGVKRRLSPEIKQKLSKVARLAQVSYGKIPKDVINRLMSIVGHMMQLRTLKRNLKVMANTGLSAKQEKDDRLQKTKQEVAEMVKQRVQYMKSKVQQQTADTDDFQEASPQEKEALKRKYGLDDALENKICDLYDLYVERPEEDSGQPVRKLYEELAALWPNGVMDNDGIKRAICKAKDRRKALCGRRKDQEKIKRKKVLATKTEDTTRGETTYVNPTLHIQEKVSSEYPDHDSPRTSKSVPSASASQAAAHIPVPVANAPNMDKPKQERAKVSPNNNPIDAVPTDVLPKKKAKRKPNPEEAQYRLEKVMVSQADEKHEQHKLVAVPPPKSILQPAAPSGSENPS